MSAEYGHAYALLETIQRVADDWARPGPETLAQKNSRLRSIKMAEDLIKVEVERGNLPADTPTDFNAYVSEDIYDEDPNSRNDGWRE